MTCGAGRAQRSCREQRPLTPPAVNKVMLTADVEPSELMKLRLLNSSHSALSCAAVLGEERVACA